MVGQGSVILEENVRGFPASGTFIPEFLHRVQRNPSHICCNVPDDVSPSFPLAYGSHLAIITLVIPVCLTWHVGSRSIGGGCHWPPAEGSSWGSEGIVFSFTHHRPHSQNLTLTGCCKHSNISHSALRILSVMHVLCGPLGILTDHQQMDPASSIMFSHSSRLFRSPSQSVTAQIHPNYEDHPQFPENATEVESIHLSAPLEPCGTLFRHGWIHVLMFH